MAPTRDARFLVAFVFVASFAVPGCLCSYQPTWESLDSRPLPPWYDRAKLGIFIHWGVFSVPSFRSEWFWWDWEGAKYSDVLQFMEKNYKPGFTYADFAPMFTAEFFDANEWAQIFESSFAQYVVLTSKHHEGFCNWPSKYSFNWNSMDVGPKRDLVGELAAAIKNNTKIHFGLYHSLFEWFNPLYLKDKANNWTTDYFVKDKTMPELYEIVNRYQPELIWSDGDWEAPDTYWKSKEFLAWLYNDSPVKDIVVVNDRWGIGDLCHHGGYLTCSDKFNPGVLQKRKFENAMTLDKSSWGFRRNAQLSDYLTIQELLATLVETVSCGGNLLVNVGPSKDGHIAPIFQDRLKQLGDWMQVNAPAILDSHPWTFQNDTVTPGVWYTYGLSMKGDKLVYAIMLKWPGQKVQLGAVKASPQTQVTMLGLPGKLTWAQGPRSGIVVAMPEVSGEQLPSQYAWVLQLTAVVN